MGGTWFAWEEILKKWVESKGEGWRGELKGWVCESGSGRLGLSQTWNLLLQNLVPPPPSTQVYFDVCACLCVCVLVWVCHIVCKSTFLLKFLSSSYAYQTQVNFYYCIQINISLENFNSFSYLHQTQLNFCYILFIQINIYLGKFCSSNYAN